MILTSPFLTQPTEVVQEKTADTAEEEPAAATTTHSSSAATSESATPEKPVATPASTTSPVVSPPVEPVAKLATPVAPVVVEEPVAVVAPVVVVPQEPAKPVSWADMILKGTKSLTSLTYSPVVPQKVSAPPVVSKLVIDNKYLRFVNLFGPHNFFFLFHQSIKVFLLPQKVTDADQSFSSCSSHVVSSSYVHFCYHTYNNIFIFP